MPPPVLAVARSFDDLPSGEGASTWRVMQLPPANELVLVSGVQPIRAKKARYYEDRRLQERILPPPSLTQLMQRPPKTAQDDWSTLPPPVVDPEPVMTGSSDEDRYSAGIWREPALPEHEAIAPETLPPVDPLAILVDEADDELAQAKVLHQRMRTVARQAVLGPGDGLDL